MTHRDAVFPANRHALYEAHGYSAAIRSGDLLFVSGQVGSRADGSPERDFAQQVRLAFANLRATLVAGGCDFDDIVDVTTFHTDPENQFGTIMAVKNEIFPQPPIRTGRRSESTGLPDSISRSRSSPAFLAMPDPNRQHPSFAERCPRIRSRQRGEGIAGKSAGRSGRQFGIF